MKQALIDTKQFQPESPLPTKKRLLFCFHVRSEGSVVLTLRHHKWSDAVARKSEFPSRGGFVFGVWICRGRFCVQLGRCCEGLRSRTLDSG